MDRFVINGGRRLDGVAKVCTAKNSALTLLAASILTDEEVVILDCPEIADVYNMIKILEALGCRVYWQNGSVIVNPSTITSFEIPANYGKEIRSSIFMLGSILGRLKKAKAVFPGGCDIGLRPIDLHLKGLRALNIEVEESEGGIYCNSENASGGKIFLDFPSVGATENIMLAAVLTAGTTVIGNAAREPEITALQNFLNLMGAKVKGAGSPVIEIEGVSKLHGVHFRPIPDRIVAGTLVTAAAITGGTVEITDCIPEDFAALTDKLNGNACDIAVVPNGVLVKGYRRPISVLNIETEPFPGFATDLQAPVLALQTISEGTSIMKENLFETRFKHVPELQKMGADISVEGRTAIIHGVKYLHGAQVAARDLRGGASLVLAGLTAIGQTVVENIFHIDRGYCKFEDELRSLGADIKRTLE